MDKNLKVFCFEEMEFEDVGEHVSAKTIDGKHVTLLNCKFEKGCVIPKHHHESEQISIVMKGCLKGIINGIEYTLSLGKGIVIPPNMPHEWVALENTLTIEIFSPPREKPNFK